VIRLVTVRSNVRESLAAVTAPLSGWTYWVGHGTGPTARGPAVLAVELPGSLCPSQVGPAGGENVGSPCLGPESVQCFGYAALLIAEVRLEDRYSNARTWIDTFSAKSS
jgi:hypothetical protein